MDRGHEQSSKGKRVQHLHGIKNVERKRLGPTMRGDASFAYVARNNDLMGMTCSHLRKPPFILQCARSSDHARCTRLEQLLDHITRTHSATHLHRHDGPR